MSGLVPSLVNTGFMTDNRWAPPGYPDLSLIDWQNEGFRKGVTQNY